MALGEKCFYHVPRYHRSIHRNIRKHTLINQGLLCNTLTVVILLNVELISLAIGFNICFNLLFKIVIMYSF